MSFYTREFTWATLDSKIHERVDIVLESWNRTPYVSGQCMKKVACYCAALPVAVWDELFGVEKPMSKLSFLKRNAAQRSLRFMLDRYKDICSIKDVVPENLEPGDVIVFGSKGPVHCMVVGGTVNHFWHSEPRIGVVRTGAGFYADILRVYRPTDKMKWMQ